MIWDETLPSKYAYATPLTNIRRSYISIVNFVLVDHEQYIFLVGTI